jgi:uncharacterized protein
VRWSARTSHRSLPNRMAYDLACNKGIAVFSKATFHEFAATFSREKFERYQTLENRLGMISLVERRAHFADVTVKIEACRDPNDDMFLELAVSCSASAIITRDPDLLTLHPFRGIPILTPADFLKVF